MVCDVDRSVFCIGFLVVFLSCCTDQAFGLTGTSRLGCQICLEKKHDGMLVTLPKATRNFYVVSCV